MKRTLLALSALLLSTSALAQSTSSGPLALRLPTSARMLGMGNVGVAGRDDDVVFYNPAQLFVARGTSMSVTRLSPSARGGTMSTVLRLGPAGIGFGVNYLEYQASALQYPITRDDILNRGSIIASSVLGTVGYAQVVKGIRVGAAAKYAADERGIERIGNVFGDVGLAREFGRYTTALSVQNLGVSIVRGSSEIDPPMQATLGVATSRAIGPLDVAATAAIASSREQHVSGGGGIEVGWSWISGYSIAGRAGFHQPRELGDAGLTAGFGFVADRVAIDIAAELLTGDRVGYRAGLRIR